jgi:hypothetical protein
MNQTAPVPPLHHAHRHYRIAEFVGSGMLVLGVLLAAFQLLRPANWWAIFILLPAVGLLAAGFFIARMTRRWGFPAAIFAAPGIVVLVLAAMFLSSASWSLYWPLMIAAPGIMLMLIGFCDVRGSVVRAWFRTMAGTGVMMEILASVFLAGTLGLMDIGKVAPGIAWWGAPMLIPGLAAIYNAVCAARVSGGRMHAGVRVLFTLGLSVCAVAAATLGGASANIQSASGLIAAGLGMIL